jgi:SNF family Na+-dependent transporter
LIINFFEAAYYNMFLAYSLIFLWDSFKYPLPWKVENPVNGKLWDDTYFYNEVLQISPNMLELGGFNTGVVIAVLVSFVLLYLCTIKGIKTSGKVEYVSATAPYVILFILLIRGLFLDGASDGISFMFTVDWSKVWSFDIWARAAG